MNAVKWPWKWERGDGVRSAEEVEDRAFWEAGPERHELRGFEYVFTHGFDEPIFCCEQCGALVRRVSLAQHRNWHTIFNLWAQEVSR